MRIHENLCINIEIDKSESDVSQIKEWVEALNIMQEQLKKVLAITTESQKRYYDK